MESALVDLGTFLYTEIDNVPGAPPRAALERVGANSLLSFARKVNALPSYKRQPLKPARRGYLLKGPAALAQWLTTILTHENVIAVFFGWYFLTLIVEIAACVAAFRLFPKLSMDTALLAALISTPFAVAAAALVVSKRPTSSQD